MNDTANLYDLQARCEQIAARARRTEEVERQLERAAKRFAALQATLTAERQAHAETRDALRVMRWMAAGMARRIGLWSGRINEGRGA